MMRNKLIAAFGGSFLLVLAAAVLIYLFAFDRNDQLPDDLRSEVPEVFDLIAPLPPPDEETEARETESFEDGKRQAQADVKTGKLIVYRNTVTGTNERFKNKMRDEYGVGIVEGGDAVSFAERAFNQGYNSVSVAEIEKKFGRGILEKVENESPK
jgi:hypothetical protein